MDNFLVNKKELSARDWLIDIAVALVAFGFGCLQLLLTSSSIVITDESFRQMIGIINTSPAPAAFVAMAITTLPLVFRRQFSWPVFIFVMVTYLGMMDAFRGYTFTIIGPAVALYTIAQERSRTELLIASVCALVALVFIPTTTSNPNMAVMLKLQNISYLAVAALAGYAVRNHRDYVVEADRRAAAAEKSREEEAARRVEEERVRIARELHDITAHSLSAVSIQAAAAERLVEKDPEAAKQAIHTIRSTSKNALEEIRSMIGVLRNPDSQSDLAPTTGTDRMVDLVEYLEDAGIEVQFSGEGYERAMVPAYIDVAVFGIAREAVTNIVRHAQAKNVRIHLMGNDQLIHLDIVDDGRGQSSDEKAEGHGIQGMRERVNLLGGDFKAGNNDQGGFEVRVEIPLAGEGK